MLFLTVVVVLLVYAKDDLIQRLTEKENVAKELCAVVKKYYENEKTDTCKTPLRSCDPKFAIDVENSGGTLKCLKFDGSDVRCGCSTNTSAFSVTNSAIFLATSETKDDLMFECLQEKLNPSFIKNYGADGLMRWQYAASRSGIIHLFPGSSYQYEKVSKSCRDHTKGSCNFQDDFRLSRWYVMTMSHSKDLILVIDESTNIRTKDAIVETKNAAKKIIDNLSIYDRANIVFFDSGSRKCSADMIPVDKSHRSTLTSCIDEMNPTESVRNIESGLDKAFEILEMRKTRSCNSVILILTSGPPNDGLSGPSLHSHITQWTKRSENTNVQIFAYSLSDSGPSLDLKPITCSTNGIFSQVTSENIESIAPFYFDALGYTDSHPKWSDSYRDLYNAGEMSTLGLLCEGGISVGLDVPIEEFTGWGYSNFGKDVEPVLKERSKVVSTKCGNRMTESELEKVRMRWKGGVCNIGGGSSGNSNNNTGGVVAGVLSVVFVLCVVCVCCVGLMACLAALMIFVQWQKKREEFNSDSFRRLENTNNQELVSSV